MCEVAICSRTFNFIWVANKEFGYTNILACKILLQYSDGRYYTGLLTITTLTDQDLIIYMIDMARGL